MDEKWERLRIQNPAAYRELLDSLPDVRDGLTRRQRALLVTMNRLGLTHDARMKSTAYVSLKTPDRCESASAPLLRRRNLFPSGCRPVCVFPGGVPLG